MRPIGVLLERHGPWRKPRVTTEWQCSTAAIDEVTAATDLQHVRHSMPVSYYTRAALAYYRKALVLLPDDSVLRCHEAMAAAKEPGLMVALKSEAASRWILAEGYRDEARRHLKAALKPNEAAAGQPGRQDPARRHNGELAAAYFGLALEEYQATLDRDPTNFEALNRYAQVFWDWRRGEADKVVETGPGLEHARSAEGHARRAVAMIEGKQIRPAVYDVAQASPVFQATRADSPAASWTGRAGSAGSGESIPGHLRPASAAAQASLGAVLVAKGRPHEAIEVLELAQQHAPEHASFDYVRWLLAQAHLCAARKEFQEIRGTALRDDPRRLESIGAHREMARASLDTIRAHERTRESPPIAGLSDIGRADDICGKEGRWAAAGKQDRPYSLTQMPAGTYRSLCAWLGVRIEPPEGWAEDRPLYLHVWGGRVDSRMLVGAGEQGRRPDPISLIPPRSRFYLTQLEDAHHQPVSPAVFLKQPSEEDAPVSAPVVKGDLPRPVAPTPEAGTGAGPTGRCPQEKNLIRLTFDRGDSPNSRAAAAE
jgi:tetratricopeptide (TPR) repeat protein